MKRWIVPVAFALLGWSWNAQAVLLSDVLPGEDPIPDDGTVLWEISDQDGSNDDVNSLLFLEAAGFSNQNSLWIYDPSNPVRRLPVFDPTDGVGDSTTLSFDITTGIWSNDLGDAPIEFFSQGIGFEGAVFGLLLISPEGEFFSEPFRNADGFDHFVTFDTSGASGLPGVFDYVVGIEDLAGGGDRDFDDMVAGMTDVVPFQVPTPGPLALLGTGLLLLGGLGVSTRRQ